MRTRVEAQGVSSRATPTYLRKIIRSGLANLILPLAQNGENIIIIHAGWGDGRYPVVGSFDVNHQLLAVHIDFFVV